MNDSRYGALGKDGRDSKGNYRREESPTQTDHGRRERRELRGDHLGEEERRTGARKKEGGVWKRDGLNRDGDGRRE
jgi:hypothetical protein